MWKEDIHLKKKKKKKASLEGLPSRGSKKIIPLGSENALEGKGEHALCGPVTWKAPGDPASPQDVRSLDILSPAARGHTVAIKSKHSVTLS